MCFYVLIVGVFFFFFFQAEDGIRDATVTGVQTCALPILRRGQSPQNRIYQSPLCKRSGESTRWNRSEERRVGKECRSRWSWYHERKNSCGRTATGTVGTSLSPASTAPSRWTVG